MFGLTRFTAPPNGGFYGAVEAAVDRAGTAARAGKVDVAQAEIHAADSLAKQAHEEIKRRCAVVPADERQALVSDNNKIAWAYKHRIKPALEQFASMPDAYKAASGYYPGGGQVQSPAGAGKYMWVPFQSIADADGGAAIPAGTRFEKVLAGTAFGNRITMQTPTLPWLPDYRVRAIVARAYRDAGAVDDFIGLRQARILGGPTLLNTEQAEPIEKFHPQDPDRAGVRYNGTVHPSNQLELDIEVQGPSAAGARANTAGNTVICAWALAEATDDAIYGRVVNHQMAQAALGMPGGYTFPGGTPVAGNLMKFPCEVDGTAGTNVDGDRFFRLTNATQFVNFETRVPGFAEYEVVGFEVDDIVKSLITDVLMLDSYRLDGGTQLFAAEGEYEASSVLGSTASAIGGALPSWQGQRAFPKLSANNQLRGTLRARVGLTGAQGMTGARIQVPGMNVIVNRISDDALGKGVGTPFSDALARALGM